MALRPAPHFLLMATSALQALSLTTRHARFSYHPRVQRFRGATTSLATKNVDSDSNQVERQRRYEQLMKASTLSLAPMMEYTDRHFRHLVRLISSQTLVYTEMVASNAVAHERADAWQSYRYSHPSASDLEIAQNYPHEYLCRWLQQAGRPTPAEGPSVLQLGGSDPQQAHDASRTVMELTERGYCDYTALNLNCGCPSAKVAGKGCFGAALMDDPALVAQVTSALHEGSQGRLPITVKCRIGTDSEQRFSRDAYAQLDEEKEYAKLCNFVETVASAGIVTDFSIHARIAVLSRSFSPADNRKIPPLKYHYLHRLVQDYPECTFSLNGGVNTLPQVKEQLEACPGLKGVMVGRAWAADPWSFGMADSVLYNEPADDENLLPNRLEILKAYGKHADYEEARGDPTKIRRFIIKAITPLFAGEVRAKRYRIALDEIAGMPKLLKKQGKTLEQQPPLSELIVNCALEHLSEDVLLRTREESYQRILEQEAAAHDKIKIQPATTMESGGDRSAIVQEWQDRRKQESDGTYEAMLASGGSPVRNETLASTSTG